MTFARRDCGADAGGRAILRVADGQVAPDVALIPFAVAIGMGAGPAQRERRGALVAGGRAVRRAGAALETHCGQMLPAVAAFMLVPDWRRRCCSALIRGRRP